jgi:DNA mismatch repair protein MutS
MFKINDLRIEEDLLPILDYTRNDFSKNVLNGLLKEPLSSIEAIIDRQQVLKGFISQHHVLKNFAYSRYDLMEVHDYLKPGNFLNRKDMDLHIQLLLNRQLRNKKTGEFIHVVLLLHKFRIYYFSRIEIKSFPEHYKAGLIQMNDFLNSLNLDFYEELIREQKFRIKHIVDLYSMFYQLIQKQEISSFWTQFFLFEAYLSLSFAVRKNNWTFPEFTTSGISIYDFYHPGIKEPVVNSIQSNYNVILLTGPNMSGKSTLLKSISIVIFLAHAGMAVPATKAIVPFIDSLSVHINLNDEISSGYSHFMSEIHNLKKVLISAKDGKRHFVIFDELFRGTNHEDAISISSTTIRGLCNFKNSFFFISTHLQELSQLEEVVLQKVDSYYIDCELNGKLPVFNYKLKQGWTDLKLGRILFEREGLEELLS